ncbi:hypothetical protein [Roseibium sp.]|uniref:hypothetical protein n=1 Tax=Roseibium sp. TaxID=1936156 RepID=UPI003BABF39E
MSASQFEALLDWNENKRVSVTANPIHSSGPMVSPNNITWSAMANGGIAQTPTRFLRNASTALHGLVCSRRTDVTNLKVRMQFP